MITDKFKQKVAEQPDAKYPFLDTLETVLKETDRQGASVASMGSEINGLTVSGLTVQTVSLMGLLGAKSIGDLIDYIERAREKEQAEKLEKILEQIDSLNDRADRVATRAKHADVISGIEAIDTRTEKLAERAKQVLEPPAATEPEELETSQPQRSDRDIEAKVTEELKSAIPKPRQLKLAKRLAI
jgi:DNA-binding ferritin-like protein